MSDLSSPLLPGKPTTIQDIARHLGVAPITVSCALSGKGRVKEETRRAVLAAARELGYRPHRTARAMRTNQTRSLGFVARNFSMIYGQLNTYRVYPFVVGMSHYLTERSYHVSLIEVQELEQDAEQGWPPILRERFFDGLVVHFGLSPVAQELLPAFDIPVIWWDSGRFSPFACLFRDEREVSRQLTRRLIELGHRRILFMVDQYNWEDYTSKRRVHYSFSERYEGYVEEMQRSQLEARIIIGVDVNEWALHLRDAQAVIIPHDSDLTIISEAAHLIGRSVLRDLTVAALDGEARLPPSGICAGGITYDRYDAGQIAANMLLTQLETPEHQVPSVKLTGQWRDGHTVRPA